MLNAAQGSLIFNPLASAGSQPMDSTPYATAKLAGEVRLLLYLSRCDALAAQNPNWVAARVCVCFCVYVCMLWGGGGHFASFSMAAAGGQR